LKNHLGFVLSCLCLISELALGAFAFPRTARGEEKGAGGAPAGSLARLALGEKPLSLLEDRLLVRVPTAGKAEPREHGIMAAPPSAEEETRIVIDAGQERMVLMAYEVFALAGDDLDKAVRADVAESWGEEAAAVKVEKVGVALPLTAIALIPPIGDGTDEANLLLGLYIRNGDGMVQSILFYVNPPGASDAAGALTLARKVAASVTAGKRKLNLEAGPRRFRVAGADGLVVTVPKGFVTSVQKGPDFSVSWLRKPAPFPRPAPHCGIYVGRHPGYRYVWADHPRDQVATIQGKLLGQAVEWKSWGEEDWFTNEVILGHPKDNELKLHVYCSAATREALKALRDVAETMRMEEGKK